MILKATSFADIKDLVEYNRCIRNGMPPHQALNYGDNGLGSTNLSTVIGTGPAVALPHPWQPDKHWVRVTIGGKSVECEVRDIAPYGVVDLNPDACVALGLKPPVRIEGALVEWL